MQVLPVVNQRLALWLGLHIDPAFLMGRFSALDRWSRWPNLSRIEKLLHFASMESSIISYWMYLVLQLLITGVHGEGWNNEVVFQEIILCFVIGVYLLSAPKLWTPAPVL